MLAYGQDKAKCTWLFENDMNYVYNTDPTIMLGNTIVTSDIHKDVLGDVLYTSAWSPSGVESKYIKLPLLMNSDMHLDSIHIKMASHDKSRGIPLEYVLLDFLKKGETSYERPVQLKIKRSVVNRDHKSNTSHLAPFFAGDTAFVFIRAYKGSTTSELLIQQIDLYGHRTTSTDYFEDDHYEVEVNKDSNGNIRLFSSVKAKFHVVNSKGVIYFFTERKKAFILLRWIRPDVYTVSVAGEYYTVKID